MRFDSSDVLAKGLEIGSGQRLHQLSNAFTVEYVSAVQAPEPATDAFIFGHATPT
jgi:hypothetical protein